MRRDPNLLPAPHAGADDDLNRATETGEEGKGKGKGKTKGKTKGKGKDKNGQPPGGDNRTTIPKTKTPDQEAKGVSWIKNILWLPMFFLTHEKNISKLTYINSVFPEAMSLASTLILELKGMIALDVMLNFTIYMYIICFFLM